RPGVARGSRGEPDDPVPRIVEAGAELITLPEVLPRRIQGHIEEDAAIARVFDVEVDFAIEERPAHDRSGADLQAIDGRDTGGAQDQMDHLADHRRLARELR